MCFEDFLPTATPLLQFVCAGECVFENTSDRFEDLESQSEALRCSSWPLVGIMITIMMMMMMIIIIVIIVISIMIRRCAVRAGM